MFCTVWLCLHPFRVFFPSLLRSHWPPCWLRNTEDFFSIRSFGFSMSLPGCSSCQTLSCLLTHLNQVSSEMLSPPTQPVWNKYFLQTAQRQITFIPLFFVVHCGSHYHLKLYHLCADSSTVRRRRQWQPTPALLPENPMDGGAWWAAVHGVTESRTRLSNFTFTHWRRKWQPTPVFLPGESQGWGSLVGCRVWGRTESDMTEVT